jgi:DNA-binding GntR family transcriptional regulator
VQAAGNSVLQETIQKLANRIQVFRQMDWVMGGEPLHGHRALLEALRLHDGQEAARLITEHIERGKTHTLRIQESYDQNPTPDVEGRR